MALWYSPQPQLTFNRIYNFVIGVRGGGKTFNCLKQGIRSFKKSGKQFIYLRRHQTQLDDACSGKGKQGDLFAYIRHEDEFPNDDIKVVKEKGGGYVFMLNGEVMGYGKALSTSMSRKSLAMPNVKLIIFDEFVIDAKAGSHERYLGGGEGEVFLFHNFYETVTRGNDVQVFFVGNAFSMVNPYFIDLKIRIQSPENNKVYKGKFWTVVIWKSEEFIEQRAQTQFYQATKGTKFHEHAFNNSFYLDSNEFIKKRPHHTEHFFSIAYQNKLYGVWVDWDEGLFFISTKGGKTTKEKTISMSLSDNSPNNVNIRRYRNLPAIVNFRKAVDSNRVYYDSLQSFNALSEIIYLFKTTT